MSAPDHRGLAEMVDRRWAQWVRYARRWTDDDISAEDLVAQAIERIWTRLVQSRSAIAIKEPYVLLTIKRLSFDRHRDECRRMRIRAEYAEAIKSMTAPDPVTADSALDAQDFARLVRGFIKKLSPTNARIIETFYLADHPPDVACAILGVSRGSARTLKWRAIRELRCLCEEEGITCAAAFHSGTRNHN